MAKKLLTFSRLVPVSLYDDEKAKLKCALNKHYVGDENCNKWCEKLKQYVAKYPKKETQEFKDSHYAVHRDFMIKVEFSLYSDGSVRAQQVVK